jgi:hypothetical protein
MERGCTYEPSDLRAFAPDASNETIRELMHELWVNRRVERVGYAGWRVFPSTSAADSRMPPIAKAPQADDAPSASKPKTVRPEELFDHDRFSGFFK